jgi:putative transposase
MRGPQPQVITLADEERRGLVALVRRHTAPQQVALRARIVLAAAEGRNNAEIARAVGVDVETARRWRGRWLGLRPVALADLSVEERLTDAARSGAPAHIGAEQLCQIVALACEAPSASGRPISQWTSREVAAEIVARGILPTISPRHAARLLKKGRCSPTASATG